MKISYVELTTVCDLQCGFCSLGGRKSVNPTFESIQSFIKTSYKAGAGKLMFTGGEPYLHPRFEELIRYARDLGFKEIAMQTSGFGLSRKKLNAFKEAGLVQAIFSIHSHIPAIEDEIMNGKNVLEKQLKNLVYSQEAGLVTFVTIVLTKQNYMTLLDYFKFMVENYPFVCHYTLNFVDPIGSAEGKPELVPKYSEVELYLIRSLAFLEKSEKSFRVERIPLCYRLEFAEYSTELMRIVTKEVNLARRVLEFEAYTDDYFRSRYTHGPVCDSCCLKALCPGVDNGYADIYGTDELYPIFMNPELIVRRVGED